MPARIQLDHDVALGLKNEAGKLGVSFDELGNRILRDMLSKLEVQSNEAIVLSADWFDCVIDEMRVDTDKPGIYEWKIEGVGSYIGRYTSISRPKTEYSNNVRKHLNGQPYRKGRKEKYRRIHCELARAYIEKLPIVLNILENVEASELELRENQLIAERQPVLNGRQVKKSGQILCHEHTLLSIQKPSAVRS